MTTTLNKHSKIVLLTLAKHADEFCFSDTNIDSRLARQALLGNAEVLSELGWGQTPFAVEIAAIDAVRDNPYPPASPNNEARKAWTEAVVITIAESLPGFFDLG